MESMREKAGAARVGAADYFAARLAYDATPNDLKPRLDRKEVVVLDVRDRDSFAKEHILGAVNVPFDELPKSFGGLPKDKTLVTYCWNITCHLATKAALELAQKGFKVQELVGGIDEWKKRGMPIQVK